MSRQHKFQKRINGVLSYSNIPGLTEEEIRRFKKEGLNTPKTFLMFVQLNRARTKISQNTGIASYRLIQLYHLMSLMMVPGLGPAFASFLTERNYTLRSLGRNTSASTLHHDFLCEDLPAKPSLKQIKEWIKHADRLSVFYLDYSGRP